MSFEGKTRYMNRKLKTLSNDALTLKLADIRDNIMDTKFNKLAYRYLQHVWHVQTSRKDLTDLQKKLIQEVKDYYSLHFSHYLK